MAYDSNYYPPAPSTDNRLFNLFSQDPNSKISPALLTAIGTGLLSGNTWNEQLANAGLGANQTLATQQQKQAADAQKNQTAAMLQEKSPELAALVKNGAMSPADAYSTYIKQQQDAKAAAKPSFQTFADGSYGWIHPDTGKVEIVGTAAKPTKPDYRTVGDMLYNTETQEWIKPPEDATSNKNMTAFQKDMMAAGLKPGTPEWNQAIIAHYKKSGMTIESDGKGGFRLVQGDINTPQKLTEDQSKNISWLERGNCANQELEDVGGELTSLGGYTADKLGVAGNYLKSPTYQKADRAGKDFLAVVLRKDSGGAITPDEIATYGKIYLPQPGDDPGVLKAKAEARKTILDSIKAGLGGAANQTRNAPGDNPMLNPNVTNPANVNSGVTKSGIKFSVVPQQ